MREKEIVKKAMREAGYSREMIAEDLGYKSVGNIWSIIDRPKTMTVASFVRILDCMGYRVRVEGKGVNEVIEATPVEHGKYGKRKKEGKVEKVEEPKIFEKEKNEPKVVIVNGRKAIEIQKGLYRYL